MIRGKNVYLRTVRESDLDFYYEQACDVEGATQFYPITVPSEVKCKRDFHEHGFWSDEYGELLICDHEAHILGIILFFKAVPYFDGFEIAYRLFDVAYCNRGIMTEALTLLTYLLFTIKKINRLELKIMPANTPSKRVAEKCGYKFEGVARGAMFHRGIYQDLEVYSILRQEAPTMLEEALARISK
jgi:ribosomal-protein-alanine N-acetyltransferase